MPSTTRADIQMLFEDIYHRVTQISGQDPDRLDQFLDEIQRVVDKWEVFPVADKVSDIDGLSPSQAIAYQKLTDFINSDETWFRLKGYAGTGKSYTIARFIQYLIERKIKFCVAAPTHKAVKTLVKMLEGYGLTRDKDFDAFTLAKLLGKVASIDYEKGKELFETKKEVRITDYNVVIIDEFSMVSQELFTDIYEEVVYDDDTKVIFVGDAAQLPPVNEQISVVANHSEIRSEASLTEIMRYDGDIARVAEEIRSDNNYRNYLYRFHTTPDRTITVLPEQAWLENAVEHFMTNNWLENPDYCRAIAWRNSTVARFNTAFRQRIYGDDVPDFIPGDRLVSRSPIFRWSVAMANWELVADNREEFTVIDELQKEVDPVHKWDVYLVKARSEQGYVLTLKILTEQSEDKRKKEKAKIAKEAKALKEQGDSEYRQKWKLFFDMEKSFDNVAHALCLTAHSAQGSSIDHVFLHAKEMKFCNEKQQILYTSLTRAKACCYVCQ